ncbi:hypothetical protein [Aestuariicoccus sp. MJ-SS9]|nr:hypothetical protein [Aestuariicoccus sp. MJ-SS9]MDU8910841.1 hypothetical protein [Aestuariicoccus sp. MJ-SS9]
MKRELSMFSGKTAQDQGNPNERFIAVSRRILTRLENGILDRIASA